MANVSHWATIEEFVRSKARSQWVSGEDQLRLAAYDMYEAIYWTAPESFQIVMRGQEGGPLYIPSGRKIVETAHRYLANDLSVISDPLFGSDAERADAQALWTDFARRERFYSKFSSAKRTGLIKGDWMFHIFADPERPEGSRISIWPIDPATYFPEYAGGDDITQLVAVHLVEATINPVDGKPAVRKLSYMKETEAGGPSPILVFDALYKPDEWGQPGTDMEEGTPITVYLDERLPDPIDSLPIYHLPNVYEPEFGWGSSEMRGVERLMRAINQAATDEELTLVLEGLGIYVTDAGAPQDEDGNDLPWNLGPARVVELPAGRTFTRVSGTTSIAPMQDHLRYLHGQIDETVGDNDVTSGRLEVAVAESGIALQLRMGPLLHRMGEKELIVTDVMAQMLYDLRRWFEAYESVSLENVRWVPIYGDKLPLNKSQRFTEVMEMANAKPPIISGAEARTQIVALGYTFATDEETMFTTILDEQGRYAATLADADAIRLGLEVGAETDVSTNGSTPPGEEVTLGT